MVEGFGGLGRLGHPWGHRPSLYPGHAQHWVCSVEGLGGGELRLLGTFVRCLGVFAPDPRFRRF